MSGHLASLPRRAWDLVVRAVPNIYAGLVALSALVTAGAAVAAAHRYVVMSADPVTEDAVLGVWPEGGVIERYGREEAYLTLLRRVCSTRDAQAEVIRYWTERYDGSATLPFGEGSIAETTKAQAIAVFSNQHMAVRKGCHSYHLQHVVPRNLRPGAYVYDATLRFPAAPFTGPMHRLQEVPLTIVGDDWYARPRREKPD